MRLVSFFFIGLFVSSVATARDVQDVGAHLLHTLDYLGVDYPSTVENGAIRVPVEYQEQIEFASEVKKLVEELPPSEISAQLKSMASDLYLAIDSRQNGGDVNRLASALSKLIIERYGIVVAPMTVPDVESGARLFAENCTACHGEQGYGDGPKAATLSPPPANFHNQERQFQRNIYSLYNTINLGVADTAMKPFKELTRDQRWSLAFYVSNFVFTDAQRRYGAELWKKPEARASFHTIAELTAASPMEIQKKSGDEGLALLAYLRAHPDSLVSRSSGSRLSIAREQLQQSLQRAELGDYNAAYQHAAAAYLEGFELVERGLDARDHALKIRIEGEMTALRGMIKGHADITQLRARITHIDSLLKQADDVISDNSAAAWINGSGAFIILLREGLEAILVLAAIFAFLNKSGQHKSARHVHAGWILALALGVITWWVASKVIVIDGENREIIEGTIGLIAAAMLIYVGYWLHSQSNAQQWQSYIRDRLSNPRNMLTLVSVSFLAVYREVFETVLFYETMWLQTDVAGRPFILAGFAFAALVLVALGWLIFKFSVRLPLKQFFGVNSVLLYALAVVLTGKGIAALQEAEVLPSSPVGLPTIEILGFYPTLQGIFAQIALIVLAAVWLGWVRRKVSAASN